MTNYADGTKYVGEFKDDRYHGKGTHTFGYGEKYVGEWKNGSEHGQGTWTETGGGKYVGEWKNGKKHEGTYTLPMSLDNAISTVKFKNGKAVDLKIE